ncbi:MAG: serine/threonine protein kinase [Deltaproteobacteria bacterium]|nr:serine/threonine protein kinase [Deltaproteobacteria bacterium]
MPSWSEGTRLGPYELRAKLGEGQAAAVWLASLAGVGGIRKKVALKLIKGAPDPGVLDEIRREGKLMARLQHPNIVDVLGVEIHSGALMVAMEYVGGGTLRQLISLVKHYDLQFPQSVIVSLMVDVLRGLRRAHGSPTSTRPSVLHRDLKPENMLLDVTGRAKVTDFGIAKVLGETGKTAPGMIKGTHRYVPPEIWTGQAPYLPRSDLFAVGCVLYELVTLRRLFDGTMFEIMNDATHRDAAEEAAVVAGVLSDLAPVVLRLLERDPERRYQSAADVLTDLLPLGQQQAPADAGLFHEVVGAKVRKKNVLPPPLRARLLVSNDPGWARLAESS